MLHEGQTLYRVVVNSRSRHGCFLCLLVAQTTATATVVEDEGLDVCSPFCHADLVLLAQYAMDQSGTRKRAIRRATWGRPSDATRWEDLPSSSERELTLEAKSYLLELGNPPSE